MCNSCLFQARQHCLAAVEVLKRIVEPGHASISQHVSERDKRGGGPFKGSQRNLVLGWHRCGEHEMFLIFFFQQGCGLKSSTHAFVEFIYNEDKSKI